MRISSVPFALFLIIVLTSNASDGNLGESQHKIVESLISTLNDEDCAVRLQAIIALGKLEDARAVAPLIQTFRSDCCSSQNETISALIEIGEPAIDPLIQALKDNDSNIREGAAEALGKFAERMTIMPTSTSITEFAGIEVADQLAMNWSEDAELIQIGLNKAVKNCINGKCEFSITGWGYVYSSNEEYISISMNISQWENNTASLEELPDNATWNLRHKKPFDTDRSWNIASSNALDILEENYDLSFNRDDLIATMYLDMGDLNNAFKPIWHIAVQNGSTNELNSYKIDADTGDVFIEN